MPTDIRLDQNGGDELVIDARRVALNGVLQLTPVSGDPNAVYQQARVGDLVMITRDVEGALGAHYTTTELWLVVVLREAGAAAPQWRRVQLDGAGSPF